MVAVAVAVLAAPATAVASPPAVDQYTQHLPGAGGGGTATGEPPIAAPGLLPGKTRAALSDPEGQQLVQIATSPGLGAPEPARLAANGGATARSAQRGFATVVANTAATGPSLALLAALAVIAVPGALTLLRRRRSPKQI
jgi:hypothetical protein